MPVAAFGGKRDIMNCVAPLGPVYQAGTLSGNPVAVACGLATLHEIQQPGFYKRLSEQTAKLVKGLGAMAKKHGVAFSAQSIGGMFGIYFRGKCPTSFKEVMECDADRFKTFFHAMLDNGVYLAPSIYEAGFVSITHDDSVIARTLEAADKAFAEVKTRTWLICSVRYIVVMRFAWLLRFLLLFFAVFALNAQALPWKKTEAVKAELISQATSVQPGSSIRLGVLLDPRARLAHLLENAR